MVLEFGRGSIADYVTMINFKSGKNTGYKDIIPYPSKFSSYFLPLLKYLLMCHSPKAVALLCRYHFTRQLTKI